MSRKMLINAQRPEQVRVAIIDGSTLEHYQVDFAESGLSRGNIYRAKVASVQPSLNAAFLDLGESRDGFLSADDILPKAYHRQPPKDERRPRIDLVLERGKPLLVQVSKDATGSKGAVLTTNVALAGRYLVLMPFGDVRGVSRKVDDDDARRKLKERMEKLQIPEGQGVIVRTNGLDQSQTTLNRDLNALQRLWKRVQSESNKGKGPRLLYSDQDLIVQALRDYLDSTIQQVVVDDDEAFDKVRDYMRAFMPRSKSKPVRYRERLPLFTRYHIEEQIDRIYERSVPLESGGSIVIDGTEALTAIDVNSGRATKVGDHEEAIFRVNGEAASEVARQLRLRDIGGLVVVDFIDMRSAKSRRSIEKQMRDALKADRARTTVGRISLNGLLEINRQRIKQALELRTHRPCPTCSGVGRIASKEFAATGLLRRIEARAATGLLRSVTVALHPELSDAIQNQHRQELAALETEFEIHIEIIAAPNLHRVDERIEWTKRDARPAGDERRPERSQPALSAKDLAAPGGRPKGKPRADTDSASEPEEARPRRRRRRRRSRSAGDARPAEPGTPVQAQPEPRGTGPASGGRPRPSEDTPRDAPTRPPRRRGGRRRRSGGRGGPAASEAASRSRENAPRPPEPSPERRAPGPAPAASGTGGKSSVNKPSRRWWWWGGGRGDGGDEGSAPRP